MVVWADTVARAEGAEGRCVLLEGEVTAPDDLAAQPREALAREVLARVAGAAGAAGTGCLDELRGSFALVVADPGAARVWARCDPLGLRELLYAPSRGGWAVSGDLAALLALVEHPAPDPGAILESLSFYFMAGPATLIAPVRTLLPGAELELRPGAEPVLRRYHRFVLRPEPADTPRASWEDAADAALDASLARVRVRHRRVGVLLSGGVDSSLLAAKAQHAGFDRCVAYTAELVGHDSRELDRARRVVRHLGEGIEHRVIPVDDDMVGRTADGVLQRQQSLGADGGFVYAALFAAAAGEVDVVLHGEAADTLFGSDLQLAFERNEARRRTVAWVPRIVRRALATLAGEARHGRRGVLVQLFAGDGRDHAARILPREGATAPFRLAGAPHEPAHHAGFLEHCDPDGTLALPAYLANLLLYGDCRTRWQWVGRLARSAGVAVEFPFLDEAVLALAARLPRAYRFEGTAVKPVLRAVAGRYLPPDIANQAKLGFPTPTEAWLRGPLRHWLDAVERPGSRVSQLLDARALGGLRLPQDRDLLRELATLERFLELFLGARDDRSGPSP